ncbi:hypothetical protein MMC07_007125 [Pseudocyphellaria aurata]|nr:hypothetical protein [Pseudocyphellaria aurata]
MAIDIRSISTMSSEPECACSGAEFTVLDQRDGLKGETIELLDCLKSWLPFGILTEEDLLAVFSNFDEDGATEALNYESGPVQQYVYSFSLD